VGSWDNFTIAILPYSNHKEPFFNNKERKGKRYNKKIIFMSLTSSIKGLYDALIKPIKRC
jgi:hypothetical protein